MSQSTDRTYEVDLACGDTVTTRVLPPIGAYRVCIHCGSRKRVTAIREPVARAAQELVTPHPAAELARDTAYGYASAYGYAAQQLEFIAQHCRRYVTPEQELANPAAWELARFVALLAERGVSESQGALRRYNARIESLENGTTHRGCATV